MILFFSRHESSLKQMNDLMEYLKKFPAEKKIFFSGSRKLKIPEENILRIKHKFDDPFQKVEGFRMIIHRFIKNKNLSNFFFNCFLFDLFKILYLVKIYSKQKSFLKEILINNGVKSIFLNGDRELGLTPPLIKAANELKIKVMIHATHSMSVHNLGLQRKYKSHSPEIKLGNNILNMIVGLFFPMQKCETKYGLFLFSKGWVTLALKVLKMLPQKPWIQGGGNSDLIFVENKDSLLSLKKFGINQSKIKLTENIDYLKTLKSKFKENKKVILFAVPIFFEHKFISWEKHEKELRKYLKVLSHYSKDVLFSFHPKSERRNYEFIFSDFGFKKKIVSVTDVISKINLYICGSSSTINLSVIHQKPTLNLCYVSSADEEFHYKKIKFIKNVEDVAQFKSLLEMKDCDWDKLIKESVKHTSRFLPYKTQIHKHLEEFLK